MSVTRDNMSLLAGDVHPSNGCLSAASLSAQNASPFTAPTVSRSISNLYSRLPVADLGASGLLIRDDLIPGRAASSVTGTRDGIQSEKYTPPGTARCSRWLRALRYLANES